MASSPPKSTTSPLQVQPELDALLEKIQDIERSVAAREKRLMEQQAEFEEEQKQKVEEFRAWEMGERGKMFQQHEQFEISQRERRHRLIWEKEALSKDKESFETCQSRAADISDHQEPITLEIGGEKFRTEKRTLAQCAGSIFPKLMENLQRGSSDGKGHLIFIDRDGRHFKFILNFIRQGDQVMRTSVMRNIDRHVLEEILYEVQYYKIDRLEGLIKRKLVSIDKQKVDCRMLVNSKYLQQSSPDKKEWKFETTKALLIKDNNLDGIVFQQIAFHHPITFENCIMTRACFTNCFFLSAINFTNVDLDSARFENCFPMNFSEQFYFNNTDRSRINFSTAVEE